MHDLNLNLFYKTSFDIHTAEPDGDVLWQVVLDIKFWMIRKWAKNDIRIPSETSIWTDFKNGGRFTSEDDNECVRFQSSVFWDSQDANYWACTIEEINNIPGMAPRQWVTEIGFVQKERGRGTFSLVLSYGDRPGFLGPCQENPTPTLPRIVRILSKNHRLNCTVSGQPLELQPTLLHAGDFPRFWSVVADSQRNVPVVYVSPRYSDNVGHSAIAPYELVNALGPSALVYYTTESGFCSEMRYSIPNAAFRCANGTVRVYAPYPQMSDPSDQFRHRYFSYDTISGMGSEKFISMLRRALAQDVHFYETMVRIDAVSSMVRQATRSKRTQEIQEDAIELAANIEDELKKTEIENDQIKRRIDELETENHNLAMKAEGLEMAFKGMGINDAERVEVGKWPMSADEIASVFSSAYPDRLVFTQRATSTLDDCHTKADILWNAFYDLCEILYDLYAKREGIDIAKEFNDRSTFQYARGAGAMTRKDSNLMEHYTDEYGGRSINVECHLKNGVKESDDKFFRIYFAYDKETRKIIVSHVGEHLPNYTSKSMR